MIRSGYFGFENSLHLVQRSEVEILTGWNPTWISGPVDNGIDFSGTNYLKHVRQVLEMSLGMDKDVWKLRDGCSPGHVSLEGHVFADQLCSD